MEENKVFGAYKCSKCGEPKATLHVKCPCEINIADIMMNKVGSDAQTIADLREQLQAERDYFWELVADIRKVDELMDTQLKYGGGLKASASFHVKNLLTKHADEAKNHPDTPKADQGGTECDCEGEFAKNYLEWKQGDKAQLCPKCNPIKLK
jgi:hypothetical protein